MNILVWNSGIRRRCLMSCKLIICGVIHMLGYDIFHVFSECFSFAAGHQSCVSWLIHESHLIGLWLLRLHLGVSALLPVIIGYSLNSIRSLDSPRLWSFVTLQYSLMWSEGSSKWACCVLIVYTFSRSAWQMVVVDVFRFVQHSSKFASPWLCL